MRSRWLPARPETLWVSAIGVAGAGLAVATTLPSTLIDFLNGGTQPTTLTDPIVTAQACLFCHGYFPLC